MVISRYFTVLVLDRQYQVSDHIILKSICLNFSQYQTFDAYKANVIKLFCLRFEDYHIKLECLLHEAGNARKEQTL
jgi:hypothetical protein